MINTLKQFVGNSRQIALVCLTILWGWRRLMLMEESREGTLENYRFIIP